ncbi:MAG: HD family phosphohydrolase [Clostridium sp.]
MEEEYLTCVQDILDDPVFQQMDDYYQHGHTTCKEHCIRVSYMSYKLCKKFGWDYYEASRAALLHDLFLYDWHTHAKATGEHFHGFTHPRVAMNNAIRYFDVTAKERNMILRHMWPLTPVPPSSKEGFALVYADKLCGFLEVAVRMRDWCTYTLYPARVRR